MYFLPHIHPCDRKLHRDFADHISRAFASVSFADTDALTKSVKRLAELSKLKDVGFSGSGKAITVHIKGLPVASFFQVKTPTANA